MFAVLALLTVVLISASCYFEEWMYKRLPNFNYFWTVACAELAVFTVASVAGAGGHGHDRAAPQGSVPQVPAPSDGDGGVRGDRQDRVQVPQLRHGHRPEVHEAGVRHGHQRGVAGTQVLCVGITPRRLG